jgi:amino acid transporter
VIGWIFALTWLVCLPFELTVIGAQLKYWKPDLQPAIFIGPFLAVLILCAMMGGKWFGELEHWLGIGKVAAISSFMIMAIVIAAGGAPNDERAKPLGFTYWKEPGAFINGSRGFLAVFRVVASEFPLTSWLWPNEVLVAPGML